MNNIFSFRRFWNLLRYDGKSNFSMILENCGVLSCHLCAVLCRFIFRASHNAYQDEI